MKTKTKKPEVKPKDVKIIRLAPVVLQGPEGPLTFMWGLGDDSRMYQWLSKDHIWTLG